MYGSLGLRRRRLGLHLRIATHRGRRCCQRLVDVESVAILEGVETSVNFAVAEEKERNLILLRVDIDGRAVRPDLVLRERCNRSF